MGSMKGCSRRVQEGFKTKFDKRSIRVLSGLYEGFARVQNGFARVL